MCGTTTTTTTVALEPLYCVSDGGSALPTSALGEYTLNGSVGDYPKWDGPNGWYIRYQTYSAGWGIWDNTEPDGDPDGWSTTFRANTNGGVPFEGSYPNNSAITAGTLIVTEGACDPP